MSGKSSNVYETRLKVIGRRNLGLKTVTLDFKAATWSDLRKYFHLFLFGDVCLESSYIQSLGLVNSYMNKDSAYKFCSRVIALPFLPAETIYPMFCALKSSVPAGAYEQLMCYIDQTWM